MSLCSLRSGACFFRWRGDAEQGRKNGRRRLCVFCLKGAASYPQYMALWLGVDSFDVSDQFPGNVLAACCVPLTDISIPVAVVRAGALSPWARGVAGGGLSGRLGGDHTRERMLRQRRFGCDAAPAVFRGVFSWLESFCRSSREGEPFRLVGRRGVSRCLSIVRLGWSPKNV